MAEITNRGKKSTDAISGGLMFEQDKNRIIGRAADSTPELIISSDPVDGSLIEISQSGYDVLACTDDQKIMSSKFNMYKIIANGSIIATSRNANVTLSGNNIGYMLEIGIDTNLPLDQVLYGDLVLHARFGDKMDVNSSGVFWDDGTNKASYQYYYRLVKGILHISFNIRLLAGSVTFNPYTYFNGQIINWEVCNQTFIPTPGGGGGGTGATKYCYVDQVSYTYDGTPSAVGSTTREFVTGDRWKQFPYPYYNIFSWFILP